MNAVITGATKGMGRAIANKLAKEGFNLVICSRSQQEISSFINDLSQETPDINVYGLQTDCSDADQVRKFAVFVQQHFQCVDVLINNVGVFYPGSILEEAENILPLQLQVNLNTAYMLCRSFAPAMKERRSGHIINICSVAALQPVVAAGSYSVTKAALLSLTKVLREELMPYKVKVTAIHPGSTLTSSWDGTTIPAERFVAADDVADAVLASINMSAGANVDEIVIKPLAGNI